MPFETLEVKPDCRHYNGYKPCGFQDTCLDCPHYDPCGTRILILKLAAAGDVLRTTPILEPLRRREGRCHVTWLSDPIGAELLQATPGIDRLMIWSPESIVALQGQQFELLMNFEKEPRALGLAESVRAERKIGFSPGPVGGAYIYNPESLYALRLGLSDPLKFHQNEKSVPEIVCEMAGLDYNGEEYALGLTEEARASGDEFARLHNLNAETPVIGLNTGCGEVFATKQWTFEGFVDLTRTLRERGAGTIALLGGPREAEFNRALMREAGEGVIDSGCHNSIQQFIGIVNQCDLVMSADTMAMHIAIGLRKRVVAIFGPTAHREVDLFGRGEKIVTDFSCSPCYLKSCDKNPTCMMALEAATVADAIERQLARLPARAESP